MKVTYSETISELVEQCYLPIFIARKNEAEWDFSNKERAVLRDVWPIIEELGELFAPYKEKINSVYLMGYGLSILHLCLWEMMDEGASPKTMEDLHNHCLSLSAEQIQDLLGTLLNGEMEQMDEDSDFWERLEKSSAKPETKWYFSQFYRKPVASMTELVILSRELVQLYKPYLDQGRQERADFAKSFAIETYLEKLNSRVDVTEQSQLVYIVSPWLIRFVSYTNFEKNRHYIIASSRIDQLFNAQEELDIDTLTTILKVMSDETRYKVLVELTKPHAKSKTIAELLNITGAAVSFHTQKLINAQLLVFNREDKTVKYNINKELVKEVIRQLQRDFDLTD